MPLSLLKSSLTMDENHSRVALKPHHPVTFPFLSLPPEVRSLIYEHVIFPNSDGNEVFILNPGVQLAILRVSRAVSFEASRTLYTKRVAVVAILPHQFHVHGRKDPVTRLFKASIRDVDDEPQRQPGDEVLSQRYNQGHIHPHILARFSRIRLHLFFPATFQTEYPLMFFDPIAELKSVLHVLRGHSSSLARDGLEIVVAVYPRPADEEQQTSREARVREDFVRRGIASDLKEIRTRRTLKVGGNFTREGMARLCKVTLGDRSLSEVSDCSCHRSSYCSC